MTQARLRLVRLASMTTLTRSIERFTPAWMAKASCQGMPVEVFFPGPGQTSSTARRVCSTCPVRQDCFDYAVDIPPGGGVWGGHTLRDLRRARGLLKEGRCSYCDQPITTIRVVRYRVWELECASGHRKLFQRKGQE